MSDNDSKLCSTCSICKCKANKIKGIFLTFESLADENNMPSFAAEQAIANLTRTMSGYTRDTGITAKTVSLIVTIAELEIEDGNAHCNNNGQHNNHNRCTKIYARNMEL
eukprot:9914849-Ditylum_brightwellii.AAC.1